MLPYLNKSKKPIPITLSASADQKINRLTEKLTIAINALTEYSDKANWSKVNCWGTKKERRWRGQPADQEGFDLAKRALEEIGVKETAKEKSKSESK